MYTPEGIPFLDLVTPHVDLEEELTAVFRRALQTAGFIGGPMVEEFEKDFAKFCGVRHAVAVSSGTDALRFAIMAAGVQPNDVVVTVPHTFIATTEAISQAGAVPEFVDIDEPTYNMSAEKLRQFVHEQCTRDRAGRLISRRHGRPVTAVLPVHLYGQMADMDAILQIAEENNLVVLEDACQAHGAEYFSRRLNRWTTAGSMGVAGAFSFYPGKNLGACGEAGAVTTNNKGLADKILALRDHGQLQKYSHEIEGYNGRLDALQAGILRAKLKRLPEWNEKRRAIARRYDELHRPQSDKIIRPYTSPSVMSNYHLYVIRVENRDQLQARLALAGITTQVHYPTPLHLQRAYAGLGYKQGDFPVTEKVAAEILSLPMYPQLKHSQQKQIVEAVMESLDGSARTGKCPPPAVKGKIWIDLENSPHVPFFAPIVEELEKRNYSVTLTARDCFQVRELADLFHLNYRLIGRHYGKNKIRKITGLCFRAWQLLPVILREKPDLAVCICSRSQLIVSASLGIPSLFMGDYEPSTGWAFIRPTWLLCPEVIPKAAIRLDPARILKYPGIKEDVYVPRFAPDPGIRAQLGLREEELVATIRPPASEAHYHSPQSDELFAATVEFLSRSGDVKLVALPRNEKQEMELRKRWPELLRNRTMIIPGRVVNGLNLIWHSDFVISGGGTMNREAAALGVPVYSVFRGKIGAVDQYLANQGRLVLLKNVQDVQTKIVIARRNLPLRPEKRAEAILDLIVRQIIALLETNHPSPETLRDGAFKQPAPMARTPAAELSLSKFTK
jgi:dTDP-4-amino-4,6-dideoxygalactose transaminase/predicted glycosyltransferase